MDFTRDSQSCTCIRVSRLTLLVVPQKNSFGIAHRVMDIGFERHLGFRANSKPKRTKMSMASIAFIAPVYLHRKAPKSLQDCQEKALVVSAFVKAS